MIINLRIHKVGLTIVLAALLSVFSSFAVYSDTSSDSLVPFLTSPHDDATTARDGEMIIVVMFEYEDCPWCEYILENELKPMVRSKAFESTVMFRRAYISDSSKISAFDGTPTTGRQIARGFGISISPTLVFLSPDGEALAPELVGVSSRDFYGYYLEKRITEALKKLGDAS